MITTLYKIEKIFINYFTDSVYIVLENLFFFGSFGDYLEGCYKKMWRNRIVIFIRRKKWLLSIKYKLLLWIMARFKELIEFNLRLNIINYSNHVLFTDSSIHNVALFLKKAWII